VVYKPSGVLFREGGGEGGGARREGGRGHSEKNGSIEFYSIQVIGRRGVCDPG